MSWLTDYAEVAKRTDRFTDNAEHIALLAAGLMGEAGSVLTELKKEERERDAYPAYRHRMLEEIGDFLWYFVRLSRPPPRATLRRSRIDGRVSESIRGFLTASSPRKNNCRDGSRWNSWSARAANRR